MGTSSARGVAILANGDYETAGGAVEGGKPRLYFARHDNDDGQLLAERILLPSYYAYAYADAVAVAPAGGGNPERIVAAGRLQHANGAHSMIIAVVDGVPVAEAFLRHHSTIRLGQTCLVVSYREDNGTLSLSNRVLFGKLVGQSVAMRKTFKMLERAAATDVTVLLEGETGTGKSASARAIHDASKRASKPFVIVECGAIPASLLESALFGHEKGAFTGATESRISAFEEANGGTIVLDEIGELSLELQPKLLGVLETRQVRRVGASTVKNLDVRVIAATNVDLRSAVNDGRFRSDLYYRLAVLKSQQPPLRERVEDMAMIARTILTSVGASAEQVEALLIPEFVTQLRSARWPGNIRELRDYLERCLVFEEAVPLSGILTLPDAGAQSEPSVSIDLPLSEARDRAIRAFERDYLVRILDAHDGKVAPAAAAAGVDRTYFYRPLRRHNIRSGG